MPISLINYGSARRTAGLSVFRGNAKTRRILPIIRRLRNANGIGRLLFSVCGGYQSTIYRSVFQFRFHIFFCTIYRIVGGCMAETPSILVTKV